ncbi:hypothetical protein BH23PLA1_BH23PLA1_38990 [soil metagenome]
MSRPHPVAVGMLRLVARIVLAQAVVLVALGCWTPGSRGAEVRTWRQASASDFDSGAKQGVIVSDSGRVRLARRIEPTSKLNAARVWALARSPDGTVYASTGDEGNVFRRVENGDEWELAYQGEDSQALTLAAAPGGKVYLGTGPGGQVVELTDPEPPAERPGPEVQYIWGLVADDQGQLFAATGPKGQLWKRSAEGDWEVLFDSRHTHLLCLAIGPDGVLYTGSDGDGVLYKVDPQGKASVVFDSPREEIRTLLVAPDGSLYAGTASGASAGSSSGADSDRESTSILKPGAPIRLVARTLQDEDIEAPRGSAVIRSGSAAENLVLRVGEDGVPREVFRWKGLILAMAWWDGRLIVGTGPEGRLFEIVGSAAESATIARVDHGQILALLHDFKDDRLLIGAGDPGGVLALLREHREEGTLTSDVLDANLVSRFGALSWQADCPEGTSVSIQLRTGDVGEPDETWSDWSAPLTDPESSVADRPPGRFAQYRIRLATVDPARTPELRSLTVRYQSLNLPPEIQRITIPDLSAGDGATRQTQLNLKWEASDPNDDDLSFRLELRKEGWPGWVRIGPDSLEEPTFAWDSTGVPAGRYRLRLTASDRPSNLPEETFERSLVSEPFLVDHQAPRVELELEPIDDGQAARVILEDDLTRLVGAEFALDGGDWSPLFPDDGLFDTRRETATIPLDDLEPGTHILMVRATDAAGNVGAGDLVFRVEE